MAGPKITFELEGTAVFKDGSRRQRSGIIEFPYRRFSTEKVDGLPLIPRACDVPPIGTPIRYRAHKNRRGTVWCCHIDSEFLTDGGSLAGRYFHEELVEKGNIKPSERDETIGFAQKCHFNGGPLLHVNRKMEPTNGKYWYRPSAHLVWFVSANQIDEGQITLLEGETDEDNPLTILINGEERGVFVVLGFIESDPNQPPRPQEVRRAYSMMLNATKEGSAEVLRALIARGDINTAEASLMSTDASERRYSLIQAYRKAYAYSVSKYGPEKRDDRVVFFTPTIFAEIVEQAARKAKRTTRGGKGKGSGKTTPSKPGSDISVMEVLAAVAKKHFPERDGQRRGEFADRLNKAGYLNAAYLAAANVNELVKVLKNQARAQATIDAAKELIKAKTAEVSTAPAAGNVEL
ncbi:MAG: hypothetical protein WAP74_02730 [Patescibacteria group bacterium]